MSYLVTLVVALTYMTIWYLYAEYKHRNDVADTAWGLGFVLIVWVSTLIGQELTAVALTANILVTIWGFRLALHIHARNQHKPEDKRYKDIVPDDVPFRRLVSFGKVFLLQGLLFWIISLPVQALHFSDITDVKSSIVIAGIVIWVIGFYFEVRSDHELKAFLAQSRHPKVLSTGLWRYSRHPNYFGEVTLWWGLFVLALGSGVPLWTIVGPFTITVLILFVSGVPLLERRYKEDSDYQRYTAKTSKFIPLPPRSR